jgi:hypothetical protein
VGNTGFGKAPEIVNLPPMRDVDDLKPLPDAIKRPTVSAHGKITEGNRDNTLWRACMRKARQGYSNRICRRLRRR